MYTSEDNPVGDHVYSCIIRCTECDSRPLCGGMILARITSPGLNNMMPGQLSAALTPQQYSHGEQLGYLPVLNAKRCKEWLEQCCHALWKSLCFLTLACSGMSSCALEMPTSILMRAISSCSPLKRISGLRAMHCMLHVKHLSAYKHPRLHSFTL